MVSFLPIFPPNNIYIYILTYRPIARQRLGKHIPAVANKRNNRIYIATQGISKHASLTIEAVFCVVGAKLL
jgi:hypothetical protein